MRARDAAWFELGAAALAAKEEAAPKLSAKDARKAAREAKKAGKTGAE